MTRATPKAAAERITAPTFSGSWKGMNRVQPSGQGSSSDQAGSGETLTNSRGEFVPATSSSLKSGLLKRYHSTDSSGGGNCLSSVIQARTRSGNRLRTSAMIRGPAMSAWPCLRTPRPVRRSRKIR